MSVFVFQWPWMLLGFGVLIPMAWLLSRARRRRREVRDALGHPELESIKWRDWTWMAVLVLLILSLARPGYDPVRHSISKSGRDVVFVLDVSRSMLAQDAYPSRLEAAKQGIRDCLDGFRGEQVALVIYAGSSSISCPLTSDYEFLRYMLSQVEPRSVEFGGTMLLSAVEKVVDQVLDSERRGFQDLVILTDGEDHGPDMKRVAETVKESDVDLLIVGLGDSVSGSRIPILNEEGNVISLKHAGSVVYTKLQDRTLGELARLCQDSQYQKAGTLPFHLGEFYRIFSEGKEATAVGGDVGYVVYREAAFLLMPIAFILAMLARASRFDFGSKAIAVLLIFVSFPMDGGYGQEEAEAEAVSFEEACEWLEADRFEDASQAFGEVLSRMVESGASSVEIAAAAFNQGLSSYFQAENLRELSPRDALAAAAYSRDSFLQAARERRGFRRAGLRLDALAGMVDELMALVEEDEAKEREQEAAIEALLERIQALLDAQNELKDMVGEADVARRSNNRQSGAGNQGGAKEPLNAEQRSREFSRGQLALLEEGEGIHDSMMDMDQRFSLADETVENLPMPQVDSIMKRPLELMNLAVAAQKDAADLLPQWQYWPSARSRQTVAAERLQEIIDLFASNSDSEGEGEWEEEEWEDYSEGEDGEGLASSLPMQGDFRKDAMMQPLPVPSFSAEEVLMEEVGSQQFRQQQRAQANAGKVEKDW